MIEINGQMYRPIPEKQVKNVAGRMNILSYLIAMTDMATMYDTPPYLNEPKKLPPPRINIIEEYGLIQLKKSKLSKRERDWVVGQFESKFEKV